jgi:hypothetical protein
MTIEIREFDVTDKPRLRDFLDVVDDIYGGDTSWVRPLDMDPIARLDKKKNPFFDHGEVATWVAYQDGRPVGRVSAQIDRLHLDRHREKVGFFGFFDTIDDSAVAQALLREAEGWLRGKGMERMRGPISLSINEEVGCLVEGFDTPPMMMMPHHRPFHGKLLEQAGLAKAKDLFAWKYDVGHVPPRAQRGHDQISELKEVVARPIDMKNLREEMAMLMGVFNDAWGDNWGFVPATQRECDKLAEDLKMIAIPDLTRLVFIDGEPAALSIATPNINEMIADLHGKLFPFGFAKFLWRLKVRGPRSGRLFMLGIKKKFRKVRRYAGMSAFLYVEANQAGHRLGIRDAELSWTLEDNAPVNVGIRMMGGRVYKRYRVYEKALGASG